jgi:uncharacterized phiE125 gp8 family phage protein
MYEVSTAPLVEPLSPAEIRSNHLRIDTIDYDDYINSLIKAVRYHLERKYGLAFITQTIDEYFDLWPIGGRRIYTTIRPVQSVSYVKYYDTDNVLQTLDSSKYRVQTSRKGIIELDADESFPDLESRVDAIQIRYIAGYADKGVDVPEHIRHAISMTVAKLYEDKEDAPDGQVNLKDKYLMSSARLLFHPEINLNI